MPANSIKPLRYRQVHLDFHTSEHITDIGADFDPDDFVATLKAAHVDSITVFAKCHHGWSYYPTKTGASHPHLARPDLMGDMIEACAKADIETPVYISVQWDERNARLHQEWRAVSADNRYPSSARNDKSGLSQLSPTWHTLCLNHPEYWDELLEQAREVAGTYPTQGLFFDIILTPDCVCNACIERMLSEGLDPESPKDRLKKDEAVNEEFRRYISTALFKEFPELRVFYNCGHIHKQGPKRFATYTHLELESLPTGGWGYDHFPGSARYAASLGLDYASHTGKFHTSWGEFGGFKQPEALIYECGQMVALGAKCIVGDQLHPRGAINPDTYKSIAPAYERIAKLEPYLRDARQVSEIAILSSEYYAADGVRTHMSDDGAVQMLQELKYPFDVIDGTMEFDSYKVLILPDNIPIDAELAKRLADFAAKGGGIIASYESGLDAKGKFAFDLGVEDPSGDAVFSPVYLVPASGLDEAMTETPFVVYGESKRVAAKPGAEVLGELIPPYFNRTYRHFCSHQHAPDNPDAEPLGVGVALNGSIAYLSFPIFRLYRAVGQPLYKYLVRGVLARLLSEPHLKTDLPSGGRAVVTRQADESRHILHLLYGAPQVRGHAVGAENGATRLMEMIEDIPQIGPVTAGIRLSGEPQRVFDALSGDEVSWRMTDDGLCTVTVDRLHAHAALVFEGT